jgi:hypothetical protein
VVEIDGIPAWVLSAHSDRVTFRMPADFWDRPAKDRVAIRVLSGDLKEHLYTGRIAWPAGQPRIEGITPNPARIGDTVTVTGTNLQEGRVLLNNKPATVLEQTPTQMRFQLPDGIMTPSRFNLLFERGSGDAHVATWPITFGVRVANEEMPHLLKATFSPTTLKVGDVLTVTFTVRNNLPTPARLMTKPGPGFTYEEAQAGWDLGFTEQIGTLNLRVTSARPAGHDPGSWPWVFGFDRETLAPGETTTVTGNIRLKTPGDIEFRVGLVASGYRFIDDNAFRTRIHIDP